ncbi:mRNA triphosphatase CET1 [Lojkania enalia]|uniref:mRNA-capping enzyme subunit beta n=1 Tax=Lojkania enalia TaxID=147567 RepID=A0A9P4ND07_9PLEO|nr:mRNA triphosphatase CET1 [Didymosphaeria enalia]
MSPDVQSNGLGPPASRELQGFERPITDDPHVYDEIVRKVCDFIWNNVIENGDLRAAIAESPQTQVEIEARWGQIQYRQDGVRIHGIHETECVLRSQVSTQTKFESTMSLEQHKKMNNFLNNHVQLSKRLGGMRADIDYKHIKEIDLFYELDQEGFSQLPPLTQRMVGQSQTRQRIRITRDARTGNILRQIIKHRIANLEISSPSNEWDYRIGINLEIQFPGSIQNLTPVIEGSKTIEEMQRKKDRMSYSWLGAFQIDLTQVIQGSLKNHELELEVNADRLIEAADKIKKGEPNEFEALIGGMMNNLRILSREMTPQG